MIIVTGSITAKPGHLDPLRDAALAHVCRSRAEDGCLLHSVSVDAEDPLRLVFYEQWRDLAALQAHFAQPDTRLLLAAIKNHAAATEPVTIYEATALPTPRG